MGSRKRRLIRRSSSSGVTRLSKLRKLEFRDYLTIASLMIAAIGLWLGFSNFNLAKAEPMIRPASDCDYNVTFLDARPDEMGNHRLLFSVKQKFVNLSAKSGYVDKVEFVPNSIGVNPKLQVESIDKKSLDRNEEKDVEIRALVIIDGEAHRKMTQLGEKVSLNLRAYDNEGRLIEGQDGQPFFIKLDLAGETNVNQAMLSPQRTTQF
jgi:hypothetical protein